MNTSYIHMNTARKLLKDRGYSVEKFRFDGGSGGYAVFADNVDRRSGILVVDVDEIARQGIIIYHVDELKKREFDASQELRRILRGKGIILTQRPSREEVAQALRNSRREWARAAAEKFE